MENLEDWSFAYPKINRIAVIKDVSILILFTCMLSVKVGMWQSDLIYKCLLLSQLFIF